MPVEAKSTIGRKLAAVVATAVACSVLLASVGAALRDSDRQFQSKKAELAGIAATLAATVSEALFEGDRRRIANALKGIGSIPEIRHVRVSDNAGKVVFQFGIGVLLEGEHEASLGE